MDTVAGTTANYVVEPYMHDYSSEEDCLADEELAHFWRLVTLIPVDQRTSAGMSSDYETWVADFSNKEDAIEYVALKGGRLCVRGPNNLPLLA